VFPEIAPQRRTWAGGGRWTHAESCPARPARGVMIGVGKR